jgi:hypothetical protein
MGFYREDDALDRPISTPIGLFGARLGLVVKKNILAVIVHRTRVLV